MRICVRYNGRTDTRLMGYATHHLSEDELKSALESSGFGDFTVKPAEEERQYQCLILAARKLGKPEDRDIARKEGDKICYTQCPM